MSGKRPDFNAYMIVGDSIFQKIGAAWNNKDGKGVSIALDAFPVDGKLVLREPKTEAKKDE